MGLDNYFYRSDKFLGRHMTFEEFRILKEPLAEIADFRSRPFFQDIMVPVLSSSRYDVQNNDLYAITLTDIRKILGHLLEEDVNSNLYYSEIFKHLGEVVENIHNGAFIYYSVSY